MRWLKVMALAKWWIGPAEWLVKVVPQARTGAAVVTGYVTQLKFVTGRTPEKWSGSSGLEGRSWRRDRVCCRSGDYRIRRSSHYEGTRGVRAGSGMTATERMVRG